MEEMGGGLELVEAEALADELAVDALFEDGAKEEVVEACEGGRAEVFEGVTGDAGEGRGEAGGGVDVAGEGETIRAGVAGEMDTVGADGCGEGGGAVEEDARGGGVGVLVRGSEVGVEGSEDAAGEGFEIGGREVFFTDLDEVCLSLGEAVGVGDEGVLALLFFTRKHMAVGDGVAQHSG